MNKEDMSRIIAKAMTVYGWATYRKISFPDFIAERILEEHDAELTEPISDAGHTVADGLRYEIERLTKQRDELKAQVERLLAKEAARITSVSQVYHRLLKEQPHSNKNLMAEAERLQPDLPENPFNERRDRE